MLDGKYVGKIVGIVLAGCHCWLAQQLHPRVAERWTGMPELILRCNYPTPDIEYVEACLPNPNFFGTGEFRFRVRNGSAHREVRPTIFNEPVFQASALVRDQKLQVLLGRMDNTPPVSGKEYRIPSGVSLTAAHDFVVHFRNWVLVSASLEGAALDEVRDILAGSALPLLANWVLVGLHEKTGEVPTVPTLVLRSSAVLDGRAFNDDEKDRVLTCLEFELPFAIPHLQGVLPPTVRFPKDRKASVILATRQRSALEVFDSTGIRVDVAPGAVLICEGDRHGRVNVSRIQFQIQGWIDITERGDLFLDCLVWFNRFLEHFREATDVYNLRRLVESDIVYYTFAHVLNDKTFNRVIEPAAPWEVSVAPSFPNDPTLAYGIYSRSQLRRSLWERLILEARTAYALHDYRIAVVNAITGLENLLAENKEQVKRFFSSRAIDFDKWLTGKSSGKSPDSVTICLNLLHMLGNQLGLQSQFTERLIGHYSRRHAIVHSGTLRVEPADALQAIEDVYYLSRCLLDRFDFTVNTILVPATDSLPETDLLLFGADSGKRGKVLLRLRKGSLVATLLADGHQVCQLEADVPSGSWKAGEWVSIGVTYQRASSALRLIWNDRVLQEAAVTLDSLFDASFFRSHAPAKNLGTFVVPESAINLVYHLALTPEQVADLTRINRVETSGLSGGAM